MVYLSNKLIRYQAVHNTASLDGLPGLRAARREAGQWLWLVDAKSRVRRIACEGEAVAAGFLLAILLYVVVIEGQKVLL